MSVVDRIALYQKHNVTEDLIIPHYAVLCTRGPLDLDESQRLGMSTVVLINQAMHSIRTPRDGEGTSSPIDPVNAAVISKIAAHIGKSGQPGAGSGPSGELVTVSPFSSFRTVLIEITGQSVPAANSVNSNPKARGTPFGVNGAAGKPGQPNGKN
jgi:hypothetical protein